ncbi:hypothetical protein PLANPX_0588 [Lacipirellula parvula]|uniref:Uncharacterized protein n=1 Tax=Lacipirellula parvula TaxID=2650471 RepID=A0A5K7X9H9_9BACT|nr:hypothetical protein PLANPX_0588 [Lacipirellula parvula]
MKRSSRRVAFVSHSSFVILVSSLNRNRSGGSLSRGYYIDVI